MSWEVKKQRLLYSDPSGEYYPEASDIFALISGSYEPSSALPSDIYSPANDLELRFSKISGSIVIRIWMKENDFQIGILIKKGNIKFDYLFEEDDLPDSIVIENAWYSLLTNAVETKDFLRKNDIHQSGRISLSQYIKIISSAEKIPELEIIDDVTEKLSNHDVSLNSRQAISLKANLYPYQQTGFQWMNFIVKEGCGCILGDEMGLGKTLQIIALIVSRLEQVGGNYLIIAPVSLLENWRREFLKFTTGVDVYIHHGSKRTGYYKDLMMHSVIVISYQTAVSDQSLFNMIDWKLVVIDEAQNIKNPHSLRTKSVKRIPCSSAIAVTGTPFENHITDVWSLMDFVLPGCLGKLSEFESEFSDDIEGARKLEPIVTPLMIRRLVAEVANDLPERIDIPQVLEMSDIEAQEYEEERESIIEEYGGVGAASLPMLQRLRMYCTHPFLIGGDATGNPIVCSTKYERLCELLEEIISIGEKTILFTSYNHMFEILQRDINRRFHIPVEAINGSTAPEERQPIIDRFSQINGAALLVLNPRAAGAGLNITAASRVIHYNLEWNPALEDQASARAYRRGQTKTVFVYRLFYRNTVEEIINDRIEKKRGMSDVLVMGVDGTDANREEIINALMISPRRKAGSE